MAIADSFAAKLDCGIHSTSQNVGAYDNFTITLELFKAAYPNVVKPGHTFNCSLCFTPIFDTISNDVTPPAPQCQNINGTIPDECNCTACPTATRFTVIHPAPPPNFLEERFGPWDGHLTGVIPKGSCEWYASNSSFEIWLSRALPSGSNAPCSGWSFSVKARDVDEWVCEIWCGIRAAYPAEGVIIGDFYTGAGSDTAQGKWFAAHCYAPYEGEVNPPCGGGCECVWLDQEFNVTVSTAPSSLVDGEWT